MKAHELAKLLLEGPDVEVLVPYVNFWGQDDLKTIDKAGHNQAWVNRLQTFVSLTGKIKDEDAQRRDYEKVDVVVIT